jgi:O-antigen/teichoic acid export membrane protein
MSNLPLNGTGAPETGSVSPQPAQSSLTAAVVRGAAWNTVGAVAQKAITLGATVIVARLLTPPDYAVAGLAGSVMGIFGMLAAHGFAYALIQRQELTDIACHSVFWFMTVTGLAISVLAVAAAPGLAGFYKQPALIPVMGALALSLLVSMIGAVPNILLQRAMSFREINLISIVGGMLSAVLGIGTAWLGYGYWALITPSIGAGLFMAVYAFRLSGYRPAWAFRWREIKALSTFGFSTLGTNVVYYFAENLDYLIMGRFWSPADFGQYYFAFEKSRQPYYLVMTQIGSTIFPALSRVQQDLDRLRRALLQGTSFVCMIIFPLHVLLIGLADPLVPWIFGEQWRPAVPVFQILAAFAFVRGLASLVGDALLALDRAQTVLAFNVFRITVILPTLVYLGLHRASIVQVPIVLVVVWIVQTPFFVWPLYRQINLSWREAWHSLKDVIEATTAMGLVLILSRTFARVAAWPMWAMVVASILVSSTTYTWLARHTLRQALRRVLTAFGRG